MKQQMDILKQLNKELKNGGIERASSFKELMEMDLTELSAGILMYRKYLIGKYHYWTFKDNRNHKSLQKASEYFDAIFDIAYEKGIGVRNPRYWFKRMHTKWELLKYMPSSERKDKQKAYILWKTETAIEKYPKNSSIQWLMSEITK